MCLLFIFFFDGVHIGDVLGRVVDRAWNIYVVCLLPHVLLWWWWSRWSRLAESGDAMAMVFEALEEILHQP